MIFSHFSGLSRNLFLRRCNLMPTLGRSVASDEIDLPASGHSGILQRSEGAAVANHMPSRNQQVV
jgi:hypothetical protein